MSEIKRWEWVKTFIEYARYELEPGEPRPGSQFPHQADADRAIQAVEHAIQERDTLARRVRELHGCLFELRALVRGECPSLLNEDSGGDAWLDLRIEKVLAAPPVRD